MSRILMVTHGSGGDIIPFVRLAEIPGTKEMTKLRAPFLRAGLWQGAERPTGGERGVRRKRALGVPLGRGVGA